MRRVAALQARTYQEGCSPLIGLVSAHGHVNVSLAVLPA